uniref:NADH dehydrogenase [ubiquinone] 1 beta subcomplex subunit 5, mitochondrial n=1 Tax=Dracunculus medinensis TaxID=318479 RepID=A0A0N4URW6_DRAME
LQCKILPNKKIFLVSQARLEHGRVFRKRPGDLVTSRLKDIFHFYILGIGLFPVLCTILYTHIRYDMVPVLFPGPCELSEELKDGPPPHYWQYERTYIRQWWAKHFGVSDIEHHERQLAYNVRAAVLAKWRRVNQRVKHLESELWDYKGWTYQPVSAAWVDYGKWDAQRMKNQYESYRHCTY